MSQTFKVIQKWRYEVYSPEACTVTDSQGTVYCTSYPGESARFIAHADEVILSSDHARLVSIEGNAYDPYDSNSSSDSGGGGSAIIKPATGETIIPLTASELTIRHATWFDNAEQTAISIIPASWQNEVMTCYLKTSVPVELSGVTWLYGEPTMLPGYTYVVALQQIGASTVLANLAYTIPQ
ncbi:MAG: hypothetical protein IKA23_02640 [Akkermansia sp.]|nr:hypothetical protein [Akkermansia sp.]MBR2313631.1 hypothetical protein [Akkermansia sp.]